MNVLNFMQGAASHFSFSVSGGGFDWIHNLHALRAMYKDLQNAQGISTLVLETQSLVENDEFLRYVAWRLDDVCDQMEAGEMTFAPSTMFMALHEYEHNHGVGLSDQGLSSLQRIALNRYARGLVAGNAYDAMMKAVNAFGEYLLSVDLGAEENVNANALKLIDAMRLALLRWMPEGFNFVNIGL